MIRLPLDAYSFNNMGRGRPELLVDLNEERYAVVLTIELEHGEVAPSLPGVSKSDDDNQPLDANESELERAQRRNRELTVELTYARAEIEELRRRITEAQDQSDIDRTLTPDEARALAAMLVHFAAEAERR